MNKSATLRRWLTFRLRTLFILVAVVACGAAWFAGEIRFVKERDAFQKVLFAAGGSFEWNNIPDLPWWREWLGDVGVEKVRVPYNCDAKIRSEAKRLFPEAVFVVLSKEQIEDEHRMRQEAQETDRQQKAEEDFEKLKNQGRALFHTLSDPNP